jgi:hypothetical protein
MDLLVRVYNRNTYPYREQFKGQMIEIAPKGFIKMDYEEANRFLGQMQPFRRLKDGNQDPTSYKWLEIDKDDRRKVEAILRNEAEEKSKRVFVCMACSKEFDSKKELLKHSKEHADMAVKDEKEE